jgi:nucleoside-diphosphate-sugar epimerase
LKKILITGGNGFVGTNLLMNLFCFNLVKLNRSDYDKNSLNLHLKNSYAVIHLAGKSHDFKKVSRPNDYYLVNTELTKILFNEFLVSGAEVFITLSSVKAVTDEVNGELTEQFNPSPLTHYGKSKLLAEQYILSKEIPKGKRVYVLRPCMIHGPGNKGNLNLLYKFVSKGIPWPLGAFDNKRSFCTINNLMFIIKELIEREDIPSGVYNVADDLPLSTNEVIQLIAHSQNRKPIIWKISKRLIEGLAFFGDKLHLPLNKERLHKLTSSYVVSNKKINRIIGKTLPVSSRDGLIRTFNSFNNR